MLPSKTSALNDISRILEILGVTRFKGRSYFTPMTFLLYRVWTLIGTTMMILSCVDFVRVATSPYKLQSIALGAAASQFLITQIILISKKDNFIDLVTHLRNVYEDIKDFPGSLEIIKHSDKNSRSFVVIFCVIIYSNLPTSMLTATIKMLLTGETSYPFEMSVFGLPMALGWTLQMIITASTAGILVCFYCLIKVIIYVLESYCKVLAHMLRERPVNADTESDRIILKLFCDITSLNRKLGCIYGIIAFLEVFMASGRCCFLAYHCVYAVQKSDYKNLMTTLSPFLTSIGLTFALSISGEDISTLNQTISDGFMESKWYAFSPEVRKTLLPLVMFNRFPIGFHYKRFVYFNMETFRNVLKTTYTMTTALSQLP